MGNMEDKILAIICVLLLVISVGYFYLTTTPSDEEETETDVVLSAITDYTSGDTKRYITASSLYELINDDDTTNDPSGPVF